MIPPPWFSIFKQWAKNRIIPRGRRSGLMAFRDRIRDLAQVTALEAPVIVDGGANKGDITAQFLHHFRRPRIHAFEPIPRLAERLVRRFHRHPSVVVHPFALGERPEDIELHVTNNVVSSSILKPTAVNRQVHGSAVELGGSVMVRKVALDGHLAEQADIIKLDLQGYEMQAMLGAERQLAGARAVLLEVEFVPMYEGQAVFTDIHAFMLARGYQLLNFYEIWTMPSGQIEAADAIYLNQRRLGG